MNKNFFHEIPIKSTDCIQEIAQKPIAFIFLIIAHFKIRVFAKYLFGGFVFIFISLCNCILK